jgi:predicted dehydrogenase
MSPSNPSPFLEPLEPTRRTFLKRAATLSAGIPFADHFDRVVREVTEESQDLAASRPAANASPVNVAVIGLGGRGSHVLRSHGYWPDEELRKTGYKEPPQKLLPGIRVLGVCDVYKPRVNAALGWLGQYGVKAKGFDDWRAVIDDPEVQAVIITTADLWHTPIALAAVQAGKDVYVEKCMSQTVEEAKELRRQVRASKCVLQVGHQNRHNTYQKIAARLYKDGVLGKVHVIQTAVGRNYPEGAYAGPLPPKEADRFIRWESYLPKELAGQRDLDKLFNWRKYWTFSTGIAGDLLSHDVDMANRVLELTIPDTATASGGIYAWLDGRETPDHYTVVHEYRDRGITFLYNASLANSFERETTILGTDATLVLGFKIEVFADHGSSRYAADLKAGKMATGEPFIRFEGPPTSAKLVTSPTMAWADGKGLTFTDVGGQRADVTRLALEEFYENVRTRRKPLCGVDEGFAVSVTCALGTKAYREGRPVRWDPAKEEAV